LVWRLQKLAGVDADLRCNFVGNGCALVMLDKLSQIPEQDDTSVGS